MFTRKLISSVLISTLLVGPVTAPPVQAVGTALLQLSSEPTQLLNNVQLILSYATQAAEYALKVREYLDKIEAMKDAKGFGIAAQNALESNMVGLLNTVKQGQGMAFAAENFDEIFKKKFPGYKPPKEFSKEFSTWTETTMDSIKNSLAVAGLQAKDFADEKTALKTIHNIVTNQLGNEQENLKALTGAGVLVSELMVKKLQDLQGLMMAQASAQRTFEAAQVQEKASAHAAQKKYLEGGLSQSFQVNTKNSGGFGGSADLKKVKS